MAIIPDDVGCCSGPLEQARTPCPALKLPWCLRYRRKQGSLWLRHHSWCAMSSEKKWTCQAVIIWVPPKSCPSKFSCWLMKFWGEIAWGSRDHLFLRSSQGGNRRMGHGLILNVKCLTPSYAQQKTRQQHCKMSWYDLVSKSISSDSRTTFSLTQGRRKTWAAKTVTWKSLSI